MKTDNEQIKKLIFEKFTDNYSEIINLLKPTVGVKTIKSSFTKSISKFGGTPHVPLNFNWPFFEGKPLSFFCQIQLDDLKSFNLFNPLPKNGILYFFVQTKNIINRYPEKAGEFTVVYYSGKENNFSEYQFKDNDIIPKIYKESFVEFYQHYSFPSYQDYERIELKLSFEDDEKIDELYDEICTLTHHPRDMGHQIFGSPQAQQGTVTYWWAFKKLNLSSHQISSAQKKSINNLEKEFSLLLQIDFLDENLNFSEFGGSSTAYFGILKKDLEKKDFNKAVLVFQST